VVCELPPALVLVVAGTLPPALFWRSMVCTIRPEPSRTTSRQLSAASTDAKAKGIKAVRNIAFMSG
jgi:hypothetical protein